MNLKSLLIAFFVLLIIALGVYFLWPKPRVPEIPGCDVIIGRLPLNLSMSDKVICLNKDFELNLTSRERVAILISGSKNLTLDCLNHRVINRGRVGTGIWINNSSDISIRNCKILNFSSPFQINFELSQPKSKETKKVLSQHIIIENSEFSGEVAGAAGLWDTNELIILNSSFQNNSLIIYGGRGHRIEGNSFYHCEVGIKANNVIFSENMIENGALILEGRNITLKQNNLNLSLLHLLKVVNLIMLDNDIYLENSPLKPEFLGKRFELNIELLDKESRVESNKINGKYFSVFGTESKGCPTENFNFSNYSVIGLIGCSNLQIENVELIGFFGFNLSKVRITKVNTSGFATIKNSEGVIIQDSIFDNWGLVFKAKNSTLSSNRITYLYFSGNENVIKNNLITGRRPTPVTLIKGSRNRYHNNSFNCSSLFIEEELSEFSKNLFNCSYIDAVLSYNSTFSKNVFRGECSLSLDNNFTNNFWGNFSETCQDLDMDGICDEPLEKEGYIIDPAPLSKYYPFIISKS